MNSNYKYCPLVTYKGNLCNFYGKEIQIFLRDIFQKFMLIMERYRFIRFMAYFNFHIINCANIYILVLLLSVPKYIWIENNDFIVLSTCDT